MREKPKLEEMTNPHRRGTRGQLGRRDEPQFEDHATSHNDPCWPVRSRGPQLVGPCLCPKAGDGSLGRSLDSTTARLAPPGPRWTVDGRDEPGGCLARAPPPFSHFPTVVGEERPSKAPKAGQERPRNQQLIGTTRCPRCRAFWEKV